MAPEIFCNRFYNPQAVDAWAVAIIYCSMILGRFPWKIARHRDPSFCRYATQSLLSSSVELRKDELSKTSKGLDQYQGALSLALSTSEADRILNGQGIFCAARCSETDTDSNPTLGETIAVDNTGQSASSRLPLGPIDLLNLLPSESRCVIAGMLNIDHKTRLNLLAVLEDQWIKDTSFCSQPDDRKVFQAPGHEHTLETGRL